MMKYNVVEYHEMVSNLCKPGEEIIKEMTPLKMEILHAASCVCGEAGELFDAVKKNAFYDKNVDIENVIEELGDIEFYLECLRQALHISRDQTLQANINKLSRRYHTGSFSNEQAQQRADKETSE